MGRTRSPASPPRSASSNTSPEVVFDGYPDLAPIPRLGADIEDPGKIRWGTIHEFKGMEAPAVVLTDIEAGNPFLDSLFCVGASRATDRLIVQRRT